MSTSPTLTGAYVASAGIIVQVLSYFGLFATADQVTTVLGAIAVIYGLIHQIVAHKIATAV